MKSKKVVFFVLTILLMAIFATSANAQAGAAQTFSVKYHGNNCLDFVPTDNNAYQPGQTVNVLFDPVAYKNGLIFYGWSHTPKGNAQYGYSYYQFGMPAADVDLYAICISPYYGPPAPTTCEQPCCGAYCYVYPYPVYPVVPSIPVYPPAPTYPWGYWDYWGVWRPW